MATISVKIPDDMERQMDEYVESTGEYLNRAELIRDSIRHRLERHARFNAETREALAESRRQFERGDYLTQEEAETKYLDE